MRRVFLCGLGINGKSTLIKKIVDEGEAYKSASFSSSNFRESVSCSDNSGMDNITLNRSKFYRNLTNENIIDRSIIDQLCMYDCCINTRYNKDWDNTLICEEIIDHLDQYFTSDDLIILITIRDFYDLFDIVEENLTPSRRSIYKDPIDYYWKDAIFLTAFKRIHEGHLKNICKLKLVAGKTFEENEIMITDLIKKWINGEEID